MNNKDFTNITYLQLGTPKQRKSYEILTELHIFEILRNFDPILVGTIPISIDVKNSDLDIVCTVTDFKAFEKLLIDKFSTFEAFKVSYFTPNILVCNFMVEGIEIEVYASPIKSTASNGYRHMLIEARILTLLGNSFKEEIVELKSGGLKTEPAFAKVLNLSGNPYDELLSLENYSDDEILSLYFHTK